MLVNVYPNDLIEHLPELRKMLHRKGLSERDWEFAAIPFFDAFTEMFFASLKASPWLYDAVGLWEGEESIEVYFETATVVVSPRVIDIGETKKGEFLLMTDGVSFSSPSPRSLSSLRKGFMYFPLLVSTAEIHEAATERLWVKDVILEKEHSLFYPAPSAESLPNLRKIRTAKKKYHK